MRIFSMDKIVWHVPQEKIRFALYSNDHYFCYAVFKIFNYWCAILWLCKNVIWTNLFQGCLEDYNEGIENSARFSIRVMEAMRSLQRRTENQSLIFSNMDEIINYIETNYNFDGDLNAQVRTALSRICHQGLVERHILITT